MRCDLQWMFNMPQKSNRIAEKNHLCICSIQQIINDVGSCRGLQWKIEQLARQCVFAFGNRLIYSDFHQQIINWRGSTKQIYVRKIQFRHQRKIMAVYVLYHRVKAHIRIEWIMTALFEFVGRRYFNIEGEDAAKPPIMPVHFTFNRY